MNDKELDSKIREEILSRWQSIMPSWLSQGEVSEKKLKGKLFSRKNLFNDNYESYLNNIPLNGLWSDFLRSVVDDCEY